MVKIMKDAVYLDVIENGQVITVDVLSNAKYTILDAIDQHVDFEGVTVKDFMDLLYLYKDDINRTYVSSLNGYPYDEFYAETKESYEPEGVLSYAEVIHECVVDEEGLLDYKPVFWGVGLLPGKDDLVSYMLDMCRVNMYMHLKITLNTKYEIRMRKMLDDTLVEVPLFEAQKLFTLHEVISAFLYEISYHGNPTMREQVLNDFIKEQYKDVDEKQLIENHISDLEMELSNSVKNEDYEHSAELRDKISMLRKQMLPEPEKKKK